MFLKDIGPKHSKHCSACCSLSFLFLECTLGVRTGFYLLGSFINSAREELSKVNDRIKPDHPSPPPPPFLSPCFFLDAWAAHLALRVII